MVVFPIEATIINFEDFILLINDGGRCGKIPINLGNIYIIFTYTVELCSNQTSTNINPAMGLPGDGFSPAMGFSQRWVFPAMGFPSDGFSQRWDLDNNDQSFQHAAIINQ